MTALRELLARFTVEVDPEGNLPKGNRAVDALRDKLKGVDGIASGLGPKLKGAFSGLAQAGGRIQGVFQGARDALNEPRLGFISQLATLQNAFAALGVGIATRAMWGFVDSTVTAAADVNDMAQRLGVTTDQFQELQGVAQLGGADVSAVATAFSTLSRNALDFATDGGGEAAEAFGKLGLQVKDSNGNLRPAIELFYEAGDAIAGLDNATEQQALAQKLLGRSARELLPVFNDLADMTAEQRAEVRALSIVYGEDFIQAASEADDQMLITSKVLEGLKAKFIGGLLPAITATAEGLQAIAKWFGEASQKISFTRGAFIAGAIAISPYIAKLNALVTLGGGWMRTLGGMGRAVGGFTKTAAPLILTFVALEDIFTFFSGGDSLIGRGFIQLDKWLGGQGETVKQMTAAFRDLWKWIFGGNDRAGERAKSYFAETLDGVSLIVNDFFAKIGVRQKAGLEGLEASRNGGNLTSFGRLLGGVDTSPGSFASQLNAASVERSGGRAGTTVIDNSTKSVQVNMSPGTSPAQVADAVSKRLEADRNSIADRVP